jgi:hypothetical protein
MWRLATTGIAGCVSAMGLILCLTFVLCASSMPHRVFERRSTRKLGGWQDLQIKKSLNYSQIHSTLRNKYAAEVLKMHTNL